MKFNLQLFGGRGGTSKLGGGIPANGSARSGGNAGPIQSGVPASTRVATTTATSNAANVLSNAKTVSDALQALKADDVIELYTDGSKIINPPGGLPYLKQTKDWYRYKVGKDGGIYALDDDAGIRAAGKSDAFTKNFKKWRVKLNGQTYNPKG